MKILYTLPSISVPHGGYLICCEHISRLKALGHEVDLFVEKGPTVCAWERYSHINITTDRNAYLNYDCIVIGSPHSMWLEGLIQPHQKCFIFMQMDERKFRPHDTRWHKQCLKFYLSKFPIIHGSHWGEQVCRKLGRTGAMHYIGNGVNLEHFPISDKPKDGKTILLESPASSNPAKDTDGLALKIAVRLKHQGYNIIGYGFNPVNHFALDEYYVRPDLATMNELYERATILLKATRYDARALSPCESMTKGTVTARAIVQGDDDLIHGVNCLRTGYDETGLYNCAKELLTNEPMRQRLADNCREYVQNESWDKIIKQLNQILTA